MVAQVAMESSLGRVLAARDQKTKRRVALRSFSGSNLDETALQKVRAACRIAGGFNHPNIISTYGMGPDGQGGAFVACSWVDGTTLSKIIEKRGEEGELISPRGIAHVIGAIAKAIDHAAEQLVHGALRPSAVWIGAKGIVRVGGFGIDRALMESRGLKTLDERDQSCLAPEVKAGRPSTHKSDIFGLGSVLYTMLTGRLPGADFVPPSQARSDISPKVDELLLRCLSVDPKGRPESAVGVAEELSGLLTTDTPVPFEDDFAMPATIAPDMAMKTPPPEPAMSSGLRAGSRVPIEESFREHSPDVRESTSEVINLKDAVSRVMEDDTPRWMVVKDDLDYGPWSGRELAKRLLAGSVAGEHGLLNMDTGEKMLIADHPEFAGFADEYGSRHAAKKEAEALAHVEVAEKRSNKAKAAIGAAVLATIAVAVGLFVFTRSEATESEVAAVDMDSLYESGHAEAVEGSADILDAPPRGRRRGGGGAAAGMRSGPGGSLTYEEAMNQIVDVGDVNMAGGEGRLSPQQVAGVMNRHLNRIYPCVAAENRRGGGLSRVQIDLAITGGGDLLGASTRQGSAAFKACIQSRVRGIRFPTFGSPRMGARFTFHAD